MTLPVMFFTMTWLNLCVHAQGAFLVPHFEEASGYVGVLPLDGLFDVGVTHLGRLHLELVDVDLDLADGRPRRLPG